MADDPRQVQVTFTRTGERRYSVSVEGPGVVSAIMDPAPGYDPLLPHDMAHFVVENELGLMGGVFGQLAMGGHAGTFRPIEPPKNSRAARRGDRISTASRRDADLSEKVIFRAQRTWSKGPMDDVPEIKEVSEARLARICDEFERVSKMWSKLPVGGGMTLEWTAGIKSRQRRKRS